MIILRPITEKSDAQNQLVVLIGHGLVGSSIVDSLIRRGQMISNNIPTDWTCPYQFSKQLIGYIKDLNIDADAQIDWIWAAGKAGFFATYSQITEEKKFFQIFLNAIEEIFTKIKRENARLHLISSAGGLFEGKRFVNHDTVPHPRRHYGKIKLQQEALAQKHFGLTRLHIYRLSSVYGYIRPRWRNNLISVLIRNVFTHRTTAFYGNLNTLRDYVFAEDIAKYIANEILEKSHTHSSISLLASGRPASIYEIQRMVERATSRRAYIHYTGDENSEHVTFMPSALPSNWRVSELESNIRRIVIDALHKGLFLQ